MSELTVQEKRFLAMGIAIAQDWASVALKIEDSGGRFAIIRLASEIVEKLGIETEYGRALAETADLAKVFRSARNEINNLT